MSKNIKLQDIIYLFSSSSNNFICTNNKSWPPIWRYDRIHVSELLQKLMRYGARNAFENALVEKIYLTGDNNDCLMIELESGWILEKFYE